MKYELKRQIKVNMICYCVPLFIALCALISGEFLAFAILFVIGAGLMINELVRNKKDEKFTFDENGFQIGETPYSYTDIEKVDETQINGSTYTYGNMYTYIICDGFGNGRRQ